MRPAAYLAGLAVHEEYRGQGLAKRLAAERIYHATANHDEDAVIYASIQSGNEPSQAVAETWADDFPYQTRDTHSPTTARIYSVGRLHSPSGPGIRVRYHHDPRQRLLRPG